MNLWEEFRVVHRTLTTPQNLWPDSDCYRRQACDFGHGIASEKLNYLYGGSQIRGISNTSRTILTGLHLTLVKLRMTNCWSSRTSRVYLWRQYNGNRREKEQLKADTQSILTELGHYTFAGGWTMSRVFMKVSTCTTGFRLSWFSSKGEPWRRWFWRGSYGQRTQTTMDSLIGNKIGPIQNVVLLAARLYRGRRVLQRAWCYRS